MKSLFVVLSLVIVLVHSQDPQPQACDKTLGPEELQQIEGDWVLAWYRFKKTLGLDDLMPNFTSSHLEIRVQLDNHSLSYHERNVYGGGKCATYTMNLTLPHDHQGHHRFGLHAAIENKDGEEKPWEDSAAIEFHPSSHNTMKMVYRSKKHGDFFLVYIRDGQHLELQLNHEEHRAMAKCLGLSGEDYEEWLYDRHSDFCHKTSALHTLGSEELHQVNGDWGLVLMSYNKVKSPEQFLHLTSSHVVARVHSDNHTVSVLERNMIGGRCVVYVFKLRLPEDGQRIHRLELDGLMLDKRGEVSSISEAYTAEFLLASGNTLRLLYKSNTNGDILATYRREGNHQENLQKDLDDHRALAKYLGLSGGDFEEFLFNGSSDFCHKASALPTLGPEELHQVQGHWVLVWVIYDKMKNQGEDEEFTKLTSSNVDVTLHPDNHSISVSEHNMVEGKCVHYTFNLTLPENSQEPHRLDVHGIKRHKDGEVQEIVELATTEFLPATENEMKLIYKSKSHGDMLAMYRKEGHYQKDLQDHLEHRAFGKYLGLSGGDYTVWHYGGTGDFCPKKSDPEPVQS